MRSIVEGSVGRWKYTDLLMLLLRMRQAASHRHLGSTFTEADAQEALELDSDPDTAGPSSDQGSDSDSDSGSDASSSSESNANFELATDSCAICSEPVGPSTAEATSSCCAACATRFTRSDQPKLSTKILRCLELLHAIKAETQGSDEPAHKTIVFSQFTGMFDLLEPFLREAGHRFVRLDGRMSVRNKKKAVDKIRKSNKTRLILVSIKAGGEGLNLNVCSRVILLDLWWNPQVENQAFDR